MITDKIFAIDVGTTESGYVIMRFDKDDIKLLSFGKIANEALMQIIKNNDYDQLVYEQFQSFGMAVGESTIESILWNGRLIQAAIDRAFRLTESTERKKSSASAIPCGRKMPISARR